MRKNTGHWYYSIYILLIAVIFATYRVESGSISAVDSIDRKSITRSISTDNLQSIVPSIDSDNKGIMSSINHKDSPSRNIDMIFSDLDGTLIHYPENIQEFLQQIDPAKILVLPPSSTGMVGVLSARSMQLVRDIRETGVKVILVSGMRASTLLKRLPYLPKADAYCCEAGGRIFYPIAATSNDCFTIHPEQFDSATVEDMLPISLEEDMAWRKILEDVNAAGKDGFIGLDLISDRSRREVVVPFNERKGLLWDFARSLSEKGYVLDTTGYSTCFRVNRKHQKNSEKFDSLGSIPIPTGLSSSVNLGCIDFYPVSSGKKNCCVYVYKKFGFIGDTAERCLCLCDDDNDLEMAMACLHAYVPQITSVSMEEIVQRYPDKFTLTLSSNNSDDVIQATEAALKLVLLKILS